MDEPTTARAASERTTLGGYSPDAGLSAHDVGRPTLIAVPSLLRSLMSEHLDPGYAAAAAAAAARGDRPRRRPAEWFWQVLAATAVAAVFALAVARAQTTAPGVRAAQQALTGSVRSAQAATDDVATRRDAVAGQVDVERRGRLEGDARGRRLLSDLDVADVAAAATAVTGPGLAITITDPGVSRNLSDVSKRRVEGSAQVILDRDLQLAVNWLWVSGAEAISVGGVRIGPNVTIRQAGNGVLVDNQPINSPYVILAVGPEHAMRDVFDRSPGLQRLRLLETSYGVGVSVGGADGLVLPAGSVREVNFAKPIGQP